LILIALNILQIKNFKKDTDVYLVDSYGESSKFYNLTNVCFVGGSIINHGGQNPLGTFKIREIT
jgi:3-deoxy-D-manno-octulosonic-acid transferase